MAWDGNERRSGRDRRSSQRRSSTGFNIALIVSGGANRRTGLDRRRGGRRKEDRTAARSLLEQLGVPANKPYRSF